MKPYGVPRRWSNLVKNSIAERRTSHTKNKKLAHKAARRWKYSRKVKLNRAGISLVLLELQ